MEVSPESLLSDTPSSSLFLCSAQGPSHRPQFLWRISPTCPAAVLSRCFPRRRLIAGGTHLGARTAVPPVAVSPRSSARRALSLAGFPRALPARLRAAGSAGAALARCERSGRHGRNARQASVGAAGRGQGAGGELPAAAPRRGAQGDGDVPPRPRKLCGHGGQTVAPPCFGLGRTAGSVCL